MPYIISEFMSPELWVNTALHSKESETLEMLRLTNETLNKAIPTVCVDYRGKKCNYGWEIRHTPPEPDCLQCSEKDRKLDRVDWMSKVNRVTVDLWSSTESEETNAINKVCELIRDYKLQKGSREFGLLNEHDELFKVLCVRATITAKQKALSLTCSEESEEEILTEIKDTNGNPLNDWVLEHTCIFQCKDHMQLVMIRAVDKGNIDDFFKNQGTLTSENCRCLNVLALPSSDTSKIISDSAFKDCSDLTYVTIPYSVTAIGNAAFWGCSGLTSVTIPDGVTTIGDYAFADCSSLTSVTIPDSVIFLGKDAFADCSGLKSVTIRGNVIPIEEPDDVFDKYYYT